MSSMNRSGGRTDHAGPDEYAVFGIVLYLGFAVAVFLHRLLEGALADDESVIYSSSDEVLYSAASSAVSFVEGGSGLLLAVLIAVLYYYVIAAADPPVKAATIAAVAGTVVAFLPFMLLMVVFEPDFVDISLGNELPGLIATVIAPAVAAGVTVLALDATES